MGRGFQGCHMTRVCTVYSWGPRLVLADRDKEFSWKRLSGSLHQSAGWLQVLCVPSRSVKHSDKTRSESLHNEDYWTCYDAHKKPPDTCIFCTFLHLSFLSDPPFQAPAGRLWQMLLHHDSLWGVQEEEKVSGDKSTCFSGAFTPVCISEFNDHFIAQGSTRCPTPPASLMAMCGPCTWNTGRWWKPATWESVRYNYSLCWCNFKGYFQTWASSCVQTTSMDWKQKKRSTTRCTRTSRATSSTVYR